MTIDERLERLERLLVDSRQVPECYSIKQAAKVVEVSPDHIRRAVTSGYLVASNIGTRARPTYRIARTDLLAWAEQGKAGGFAPGRRRASITPRSRHHRPSNGHSDAPDS